MKDINFEIKKASLSNTMLKIYGVAIVISFLSFFLVIYLVNTYYGLTHGLYATIVNTNTANEHFFEIALLVTGCLSFYKTRHMHFISKKSYQKLIEEG